MPICAPVLSEVCRPQTSFQHVQRDIYGMISDAKTLFLGVVSFADFAPKGRLTCKLTHTVNRAAPVQAFMGAVPIVVGDPLRELIADVGRVGVGSVPELLQWCCHGNLALAERKSEGLGSSSRRRRCLPILQRFASEGAERVAGNKMALNVERVMDDGVNG